MLHERHDCTEGGIGRRTWAGSDASGGMDMYYLRPVVVGGFFASGRFALGSIALYILEPNT